MTVPDRIVHAEADELAEKEVIVDLLDQLELAPHPKEDLQQERP